jgi:gamma-glutamylcysteine synthetase
MTAAAWLDSRTAQAPPQLRTRMLAEIREAPTIPETLADAARACLVRVVREPTGSDAALDLLAADALLTHACGAAAEQGDAELAALAATLDAVHFQQLLDQIA